MENLAQKTAFITGGASGIGLGIAQGMAEAGAQVALVARDAEKLAQAKLDLEKTGRKIDTFSFDLHGFGVFHVRCRH